MILQCLRATSEAFNIRRPGLGYMKAGSSTKHFQTASSTPDERQDPVSPVILPDVQPSEWFFTWPWSVKMYQTESGINQDFTPKEIIITNLTAGRSLSHLCLSVWCSFCLVWKKMNQCKIKCIAWLVTSVVQIWVAGNQDLFVCH